jgi:long-chain acyl-CoA synthetase
VTPEALQAWTKERVAAYKYPRHVLLVDELSKSPTGKILKRSIDRGPLLREPGVAATEPGGASSKNER